MRYHIAHWPGPDVELEVPGDCPPCLWCGVPVAIPSCDGPLVCGPCDMGRNRDGTPKDADDYRRSRQHAQRYIEAYRVEEGP